MALATFAVATASAALPDGRVYEMVSPVKKDSNAAGASFGDSGAYALSSETGERILFRTDGAVGDANSGLPVFSVAERGSAGWTTRSALPRPKIVEIFATGLSGLLPSKDLSKIAFAGYGAFSPDRPPPPAPGGLFFPNGGMYISPIGGPGTWISRPLDPNAETDGPLTFGGANAFKVAGGSPDLSVVYFGFTGTLLPEDAARVPFVQADVRSAAGFYEYREGTLRAAGELPDGSLDPQGAVPAALSNVSEVNISHGPDSTQNGVSEDGQRAFFVSPDPAAGSSRPSQLYERIDGDHSVLVSRAEVTTGEAPAGVVPLLTTQGSGTRDGMTPYVYASPDGSRAVFRSPDQLTADAPADAGVKPYMFDLDTGTVRYVPEISGAVIGSSDDGSRFLFLSPVNQSVNFWEEGTVTKVATMNTFSSRFTQVQSTADGSVFVFDTSGEIDGIPNPNQVLQAYRYDLSSQDLQCVSCPTDGSAPAGNAAMGSNATDVRGLLYGGGNSGEVRPNHEISSDGSRVFFDTTDSLVKRDTNGRRDVYAWENGTVFLISPGTSSKGSLLLDNSASGNDVFFTTAQAIEPEDTDGAYDVYDARVGGGFASPPVPADCGGNCQVPAAAPLPTVTGSADFRGAGNGRHRARKPHRHRQKRHGAGTRAAKHRGGAKVGR